MCFPDVYEIGMSNLGMMILYNMFNQREDVWCERLFSPWPDLDKVMREKKIPLFALESQEPSGILISRNYDRVRDVLHQYPSGTGSQWYPAEKRRPW